LIEQPLGRLGCRERAASRVLVLNLQPVAVDPVLVELFKRELDSLLVLHAEIGPGAGHGKQTADLDRLVLRVCNGGRSEQRKTGGNDGEAWNERKNSHGALP
jgi:hypothetical protein